MLLNNQCITKESKSKLKKKKKKKPRNKSQQKHGNPKLMDTAKAVLRGKFTAIQSYLRKQEKS